MPLLSLRTRLVALFLVSLATAAFLFAAVAVRQFSQEERSQRALRADPPGARHRQADQRVRRAAPAQRRRCAAGLHEPPRRHHGGAGVLRRALRPAAADRGALRQRAEGHGGPARLDAARQDRQAAAGAGARPQARRRHVHARRRSRTALRRPADRRDHLRAAGALDQRVDARAGPARRPAAAPGGGRGRARRRFCSAGASRGPCRS